LWFHILFCWLVDPYGVVSWQLGLVEREINDLLQPSANESSQRSALTQATPPADTQNIGDVTAGTVPQRELSEDDICPICQDELLANHQPVTFCRYDFVTHLLLIDVNKG